MHRTIVTLIALSLAPAASATSLVSWLETEVYEDEYCAETEVVTKTDLQDDGVKWTADEKTRFGEALKDVPAVLRSGWKNTPVWRVGVTGGAGLTGSGNPALADLKKGEMQIGSAFFPKRPDAKPDTSRYTDAEKKAWDDALRAKQVNVLRHEFAHLWASKHECEFKDFAKIGWTTFGAGGTSGTPKAQKFPQRPGAKDDSYAKSMPHEDFAVSVEEYLRDTKAFTLAHPTRAAWLKKNLFRDSGCSSQMECDPDDNSILWEPEGDALFLEDEETRVFWDEAYGQTALDDGGETPSGEDEAIVYGKWEVQSEEPAVQEAEEETWSLTRF